MTDVGVCTATLLHEPMLAGREELVAASAAIRAAGATKVSVWAQHLEMLGSLAEVGLELAVLEAAVSWAGGPGIAAGAEAEALVATGVDGGATKLLAVCLDPTFAIEQAREGLAQLVALAEQAGIQVCVEFLPWSAIPDLATAWSLVEPLGPAAGIVLDTWHWQRQPGGPALELLASIPGERIGYVQLCDADATGSDSMAEAMSGRLLPGEGVVDFASLAAVLASIDADPVVTTEVFNPGLLGDRGVVDAAAAMVSSASAAFTIPV